MPKILSLMLCAALLVPAAGPASALSLEDFLGYWRGQGALLDTGKGRETRVRCALTGAREAPEGAEPEATESTAPAPLALMLKCASRRGARSITISVAQTASGGIDRVTVDLPEARAQDVRAIFAERRITLAHAERGELTLERTEAGMTLELAGLAALTGTLLLE